jgi:MFS family permease
MAQAEAHPRPASKPRKFRARDLRHVSVNPWLIAITVSLATFMEVMDTSIANVALRHIAGSLAAGQSESTWVLTSYLVSNAIILPISGWLASVMGRKRFYMTCVGLAFLFVPINTSHTSASRLARAITLRR